MIHCISLQVYPWLKIKKKCKLLNKKEKKTAEQETEFQTNIFLHRLGTIQKKNKQKNFGHPEKILNSPEIKLFYIKF